MASAVTACGSQRSEFFALPDAAQDGQGSYIVALIADGRIAQLEARDDSSTSAVLISSENVGRLELVSYDVTLDRLRIPSGPLPLGLEQSRGSQLLPDRFERRVFSAELSSPRLSWVESAVGPELSAQLLPRNTASCDIENIEAVNLDSTQSILFAVSVPGGGAIMGDQDARLFFVNRVEGQSSAYELTPDNGALITAGVNVDGELYLIDSVGRISPGELAGNALHLGPTLGNGAILSYWMAGGVIPEGGVELFTLSRGGVLMRTVITSSVTSTRETIHVFDRSTSINQALAGLTWVGPGHALAGVERMGSVLRYREGELSFEQFGGATEGLADVLHTSAGRTYLSSTAGKIFEFDSGAWHRLPIGLSEIWVPGLAEIEDGFVYVAAFGNAGFYLDGFGECPEGGPTLIGGLTFWTVVPIGDGFYAASGLTPSEQATPLIVFEPVVRSE